MKAALIHETGTPDVIQYADVPVPEPGPTEVLVKVGAVAVNPIDTYIRAGAVKMVQEFPYVVGCDLAGTVEKLGSQVAQLAVGDRVWGSNQGLFGRQGTFAEYAAVDEKWLYRTPPDMSDVEAVAGALVGITAQLGLFQHARLQAGEVLFVNGGTGGVGHAVVQMAKSVGASVVATVGSEEKKKLCRDLGADLVLDYHSSSLDDEIRKFAEPNGGVNVWYETQRQPTLERTIKLMAKRGRIVLMAGREARPDFPLGAFYTNDLSLHGFAMFNATPEEQSAAADMINLLYEAGNWKPLVGKTFRLAEAAAAHRLQEENTLGGKGTLTGKIVLQP